MFRKIIIFILVVVIGGIAYWLASPFLSNSVVYENENNSSAPVVVPEAEPVMDESVIEIEQESTSTPEPAPAKPIPVSTPKPAPTPAPSSTNQDITDIENFLNSFDLEGLDSGL